MFLMKLLKKQKKWIDNMDIIRKLGNSRMITMYNLDCISELENEHMLDNMLSGMKRFKSINHEMHITYTALYCWKRWVRS